VSDKKIEHVTPLEILRAKDSSWLNLGQLRELVAEADRLGWLDSSLVSLIGSGGDHPYRADLRTVRGLAIEGGAKS
jgi:hypothetical protein